MKKSRFSEEQILGILREGAGETPIKAVCARHNISEPFHRLSKLGIDGKCMTHPRLKREVGRIKIKPLIRCELTNKL